MTLTLVLGSYSSAQASSILIPQAVAKIYYVSTTGNDANSGALTTPFKTISKAINTALTGDSIYVRAGTYPSFAVSKSGITIAAYSGERPLISGGIGIRCYNASNVTIKGFEVTGVTGSYIGAIMLDGCNSVVVDGNKVHDNIATSVSGITISGSNNKILNNEVFNNNFVGIRVSGTSLNNEIAFNRVYNHTLSAGDSDGIDLYGSAVTQTNIHDNTVYGNSDDGIDTWDSPANIITNNVAYGNGGTGDGNGFKFGGNTTGGNNTVFGNTAYSNETCGFTSNGSGNYYESNTSHDNGTCGFDDSWRSAGDTKTSSYINNRAYNNPTGNFKKSSYTTVFIGNLETPVTTASLTPTKTSTAVVVISPTVTATKTAIPTVTATKTAVPTFTATKTIVPTITLTVAPVATNTIFVPSPTVAVPNTSTPVPQTGSKQYYVSATGNDANIGTLAAPFKTISKAINIAVTGDSIYVRAGTYPSFAISKSGISIAGYNGEMPIISGGIGIRCYNANNVIIQGFEVTGASGNYIGAIMLDNCSSVTVQGNKVHDNTAATVAGIILSGSNNKILNNEVFNNNYSGIRLSGTSLNNEVAFNRVYNHTMSAGDSDGIDIAVSSVTRTNIHDNTVFGNSDDGIDTWVSPENIITNNITYGNGGTGDGNGIKLGGDTNGGNNTVTGNISYANETCGFTSNGNGNYYESNTSYDNGTCGFDDNWRVAGNTQKSSFINNRAYNNPTGNFRTLANYLTIFIGNLETAPGATPLAATSTAIPVASPTFTATIAAPTIAATNTAAATPTASPMPIVPTVTNSAVPTVTSQPTSIPATSIPATSIPVSNNGGLNIRVTAGSDDVEESSSGVMSIDSSDLELVYDVNAQVIGIRFTGVSIPQGATITNAYIQFKVDETSSKAIKLTIKGEASANASAFTSAARNVSNRSRTAASVVWSPSAWPTVGDMGKAQQTPNLQAIVQEITNQPNWASGNALVMIITGNRGNRVASAFENDAAGAPLLHIEFSMPAQAVIAPLVSTAAAMPAAIEILPSPTATEMILPTEPPIATLFPSTPTSTPIPATP